MLDITVTGYEMGRIGNLAIMASGPHGGKPIWVLFDPRNRDPHTGHCLQREFTSFAEAMDEYDQIVLQAAVEHVKAVKSTYAKMDYYGAP